VAERKEISVLAEISREIVRLYARFYGRGPTRARTIWQSDVIVVVLGEVFTRAETVLLGTGHFDQVRLQRGAFHAGLEPLFRHTIERITGRSVRAFLSQVSEEGVAAEVFVLVRTSESGDPVPQWLDGDAAGRDLNAAPPRQQC
jgi:uncharacterized protein YbcI